MSVGPEVDEEDERGDLLFGTIPGLVRSAAERFADRVAVEEPDGGRTLTFRELHDNARSVARGLMATGLGAGDRVAVWMPNSLEWVVAALGAMLSGARLVPINTRFKAREATYVLEQARPAHLFTTTDFLGRDYLSELRALGDVRSHLLDHATTILRGPVPGGARSLASLAELSSEVSEADLDRRIAGVEPDSISDIFFTSGTTGRPKGVQTTHAQNLRAFMTWSRLVRLRTGDRYLVVNPFFHCFGYKAGILACLMRGATILPVAVFEPADVLETIERDRISVLPGPPTLYQSLLNDPRRADHDISSVRLAVTGAAPTPVSLVVAMKEELGFETVVTGYGLTECCGIVSLCRHDDYPETIAETSGRAIDGVEIAILDDAGRALAPGEPGEIVVRGYNLMVGYYDDPEATDAAIDADGWLRTGDIGFLDEEGYVHPTDRKKDVFLVGGFNAYPAEIEAILITHPEVAQCAVVGVPDERLGEVGKAFVVLAPGSELTGEALIAWAREQMANYKVPREVVIMAQLPMNASGKVLKEQLKSG